MNIAKAGVANALTSLASDHVVAVAADVYDETLDKYLSDLNKDFKQLKVDWLISNPNLDFDASGNNGDYYGYVGNLQNINVLGDSVLIDTISVYVREGRPSPNLTTPVWCRLLKFVDDTWKIIYQSSDSKTIGNISPETLFTFKMNRVSDDFLIKTTDRIAIVYADSDTADVLLCVQLGFKAINKIGGLLQPLSNTNSGLNWCPAFVFTYLPVTSDTLVNLSLELVITAHKHFNGGITIADKSVLTNNIDQGELKVLHKGSTKGFIIKTVNGDYDVLPLRILSTDGVDSSYEYSFQEKSGTLAHTSDIPTSLKNPNSLTFGTKTYDGSSPAQITAADLGLSAALKYCGITTTELTDGSTATTITIDSENHTAYEGCVVFYGDKEFVFNGTKWEELGYPTDLSKYKTKQTAVSDPTANGTTTSFIDTISQNENGEITVTKKSVDFPSAVTATTVSGWGFATEQWVNEQNFLKEHQDISNKVDKDDNAPKLTAGFANNLVGRGEATEEEISFRPSGGDTSIEDGTARIERLKGNTVVWNQLIDGCITKEDFEGVTTYYDSTKGEFVLKNLSRESNYISGSTRGIITPAFKSISGHRCYLWCNKNIKGLGISDSNVVKFRAVNTIFNIEEVDPWYLRISRDFDFATYCPVGSEMRFNMRLYDLTQMFGEGNEPNTIEEFNARKPIGIDEYAYNEGELISTNVDEIKSVGFNALNIDRKVRTFDRKYTPSDAREFSENEIWDGFAFNGYVLANRLSKSISNVGGVLTVEPNDTDINYGVGFPVRVLPSTEYYIKNTLVNGTFAISYFDKNGVFLGEVNFNSKFTTPSKAYWAVVCLRALTAGKYVISEAALHLAHTGYRNGEYEPYKEFRKSLPISEIKDSDGNQLFPNGLLSAGSVYDEITATKAIKRIGVRAYQDGDTWTDGVATCYELAEPIEVDLEEPINMDYEVCDFGTEEVISDVPTTPLKADIIYQFNAVDRIRENSKHTTITETTITNWGFTKNTGTVQSVNNITPDQNGNVTIDVGTHVTESTVADWGFTKNSGIYGLVEHGTSDTTFILTPNTFHTWDEVAELTLTFGEETTGVVNEYLFQFISGSEPTILTLPDSVIWANEEIPIIEAGYTYQTSIVNNCATCLKFKKS